MEHIGEKNGNIFNFMNNWDSVFIVKK